jgi:hypothetical protein
VSAKWRALMRSNIETRDGGKTNLSNLAAYVSQLSAIITIAGFQNAEQVAMSLMEEPVPRDGLQLIANSVAELREVVVEKVTSYDMDVLFCPCGTSFDAMWMTDNFNSGREGSKVSSDGLVLCTTNLGLKLTRSVTKDRNTEYEDIVLLGAKVALQSATNDLIGTRVAVTI